MAKYLLLKHYRRTAGPENVVDIPMEAWSPEEIDAHHNYMHDFAAKLEQTGEFVDGQALSPEGTFVRYDGAGRPPVTDGPFAETKDLRSFPPDSGRNDLVKGPWVSTLRGETQSWQSR